MTMDQGYGTASDEWIAGQAAGRTSPPLDPLTGEPLTPSPQYGQSLPGSEMWTRKPYASPTHGNLPVWFQDRIGGGPDFEDAYYTDALNRMTAEEILNLQYELWSAGLFGLESVANQDLTVFRPGILDDDTRSAFSTLVSETAAYQGARSLEEMLRDYQTQSKGLHEMAMARISATSPERATLTDPMSIAVGLQSYAERRMGARIGYGQLTPIVERVKAQERAHWSRVLGARTAANQQVALAEAGLSPEVLRAMVPQMIQAGGEDSTAQQYFRNLTGQFGVMQDSGVLPPDRNEYASPAHEMGLGAVMTGDAVNLERLLTYAWNHKGQGQLFDEVRILERDAMDRPKKVELIVNDGAAMPQISDVGERVDQMGDFLAAVRGGESYEWVQHDNGGWGAYRIPEAEYNATATRLGISTNDHSAGAQDRIARDYAQRLNHEYASWERTARHLIGGRAAAFDPQAEIVMSREGEQDLSIWQEARQMQRQARDIVAREVVQRQGQQRRGTLPMAYYDETNRMAETVGAETIDQTQEAAKQRASAIASRAMGGSSDRVEDIDAQLREIDSALKQLALPDVAGGDIRAERMRLYMERTRLNAKRRKLVGDENAKRKSTLAQVQAMAETVGPRQKRLGSPDAGGDDQVADSTGWVDAIRDYVSKNMKRHPLAAEDDPRVAEAAAAMLPQPSGMTDFVGALEQGRFAARQSQASAYSMSDDFDAEARAIAEFEQTHGPEIHGRNVARLWADLDRLMTNGVDNGGMVRL